MWLKQDNKLSYSLSILITFSIEPEWDIEFFLDNCETLPITVVVNKNMKTRIQNMSKHYQINVL